MPERRLRLILRYDDAFIAYLNGEEVVRAGVGEGRGARATNIASHGVDSAPGHGLEEATGWEYFDIKDHARILRNGENVLAIEGHNRDIESSDFTLNPCLEVVRSGEGESAVLGPANVAGVEVTDYAVASKTLVVMDRHSGEVLWTRPARHSFRHN